MQRSFPPRYIVLLVFVAIFLAGINTEEFRAVLEKATKVCLSCVGIG